MAILPGNPSKANNPIFSPNFVTGLLLVCRSRVCEGLQVAVLRVVAVDPDPADSFGMLDRLPYKVAVIARYRVALAFKKREVVAHFYLFHRPMFRGDDGASACAEPELHAGLIDLLAELGGGPVGALWWLRAVGGIVEEVHMGVERAFPIRLSGAAQNADPHTPPDTDGT